MIIGHSRIEITRLYLILSISFLIEWLFHIDLSFILFFVISSSCCGVLCRHLITELCVVTLKEWYDLFFVSLSATFYSYVHDLDKQIIFNQTKTTNQIMWSSVCCKTEVISILVTIIKFVSFELISHVTRQQRYIKDTIVGK